MKTNMSVCSVNEKSAFERYVNVSRNAMRSSYVVRSCCKADVLLVQCMVITFCCKRDATHAHDNLLQR